MFVHTKLPLDINPEIVIALESNIPVVALESTIITHGMDYPTNIETALSIENIIRKSGAIPATIAIIKGRIKVGLTVEEITEMGKDSEKYCKCSRRDLAYILAKQGYGSTTVATTMICAHMAGIKVFATGGIGGVHRGGEVSFDVSADLQELGKTPVAVICAGVKSILDIPKTLEYLETQGVPVIGYQTQNFPAFYTSDSGEKCSHSVESAQEAAALIQTQFQTLNLQTGILFGVPIPKEEEANGQMIQEAISEAITQCQKQGVTGASITPFLLRKVNELTGGESVKSNIALILNNARVAAQISVAMCKQKSKKQD